jgi:hypothetical protein
MKTSQGRIREKVTPFKRKKDESCLFFALLLGLQSQNIWEIPMKRIEL